MDYYEYNILNPDNNGSKGQIFSRLKIAALILLAIAISIILMTMEWDFSEGDATLIVFTNLLKILLIIVPIISAFLLFRYLSLRYFDFDYFIIGRNLSFVKIINKIQRKRMYELDFSSITQIGIVGSDTYEKHAQSIEKKYSFVCNRYASKLLYIVQLVDSRNVLIICHYDEAFLTALHKAIKRESVFDKSTYLEKKANN